MMDKVKLAIAGLILAGGITAFYYFEDHSLFLRVIGLLLVAGVTLAVAFQTEVGRRTWSFVGEAQLEVKKVVRPTRKETLQTTAVVVGMVFVVALFLWLLDSTLLWLVEALTGQGS
jgi:preprotein translocase subunit SecE